MVREKGELGGEEAGRGVMEGELGRGGPLILVREEEPPLLLPKTLVEEKLLFSPAGPPGKKPPE